jgi:hypothetical protein
VSQIIEIRSAFDGSRFDWRVPDELWIDMQAFAAARGWTIEELINRALTDFSLHEFLAARDVTKES